MTEQSPQALAVRNDNFGIAIKTMDDLLKVGATLVASGLLPKEVNSKEKAAVTILRGRELGIPMMESFSLINIIDGKSGISPQGMLALIERSKLSENITITDNGDTCTVTMKRVGRDEHTESFSMADATAMNLAGKHNWKAQPKTMRKWRAIAACARVVYPDVIGGMYTPDELGALTDEEGRYVPPVQVSGGNGQARAAAEIASRVQEQGGEVVEGSVTEAPPDHDEGQQPEFTTYTRGVVTYRKIPDGADQVYFAGAWRTHSNEVTSLTDEQVARFAKLFKNMPDMIGHLNKHFQKKSVRSLTWEQLLIIVAWKKDGLPDKDAYPKEYAEWEKAQAAKPVQAQLEQPTAEVITTNPGTPAQNTAYVLKRTNLKAMYGVPEGDESAEVKEFLDAMEKVSDPKALEVLVKAGITAATPDGLEKLSAVAGMMVDPNVGLAVGTPDFDEVIKYYVAPAQE